MKERWKSMVSKGFSRYEISTHERIRNARTQRLLKHNARGGTVNLRNDDGQYVPVTPRRMAAVLFGRKVDRLRQIDRKISSGKWVTLDSIGYLGYAIQKRPLRVYRCQDLPPGLAGQPVDSFDCHSARCVRLKQKGKQMKPQLAKIVLQIKYGRDSLDAFEYLPEKARLSPSWQNVVIKRIDCSPAERWKDIEQFKVSTLGRCIRKPEYRTNWFGMPFCRPKYNSGYEYVLDRQGRSFAIHRLVAKGHLGVPLIDGCEIDHKNGNRRDNRVENLKFSSSLENKSSIVFNRIVRDRIKSALDAASIEMSAEEISVMHSWVVAEFYRRTDCIA